MFAVGFGGAPQNGASGQSPLEAVTGGIAGKIPPTLTFTTVSGGPNSAHWKIKWKLAKGSKAGGWIVQEVTQTDPDGNLVRHFWEAWQVPPKSRVAFPYGDSSYDDLFKGPASGSTVNASARFYERLGLPSSFAVGNEPVSGILRSATANPHLPTFKASLPVNRTWSVP
jgi:hypothetical protein